MASGQRRTVPPGPAIVGDDGDGGLLEVIYEIAAVSLDRVISPSLADFLA